MSRRAPGPLPLDILEAGAPLVLAACHDFAGALATAGLGLDLLGEDADSENREEALALVRDGFHALNARLAFLRAAFSGGGAPVAATSVEAAARALFEGGKASLSWRVGAAELAAPSARLMLHLVHLCRSSLPAGGVVTLADREGRVEALAAGRGARLSPAAAAGLALEPAPTGPATDWIRAVCVASAAAAAAGVVHAETTPEAVRYIVETRAPVIRARA